MHDRISTGIKGLDELVEGGFPKGSFILLAGSPGSGKTIASAQFLYYGAKKAKENGVYISFGERKRVFYDNMKKFSFDFKKLESKGKFKFLDMLTPRDEEISVDTLNAAFEQILAIKAKRLVIDSFSALSLAFSRKIDARIALHMLEKLTREINCTTLLILEVPTGHSELGLGFEEFVVDGIILFETIEARSGIRKRAILRKMRGTNHNQNYTDIVISGKGLALMPYVT